MANFLYTAKNKEGQTVKGGIEASNKKQALDVLRGKGLLILKLEEGKKGMGIKGLLGTKKVTMDELVVFFRQLATMIESGIPVVASLDILVEQVENPSLKKKLAATRDDVNTGFFTYGFSTNRNYTGHTSV